MNKSRHIVTDFLKRFLNTERKQETLLLNFSTPKILDISTVGLTELKNDSNFSIIEEKLFDLIIGDLPFGMQSVTLDTVSKLKTNKNWGYILTSLRRLEENGKAFFLVEPSILFSQQGKRFLNDLAAENFYCNSVFELPEKLLYLETAFLPVIIHFEKQKQDKLFIAEITDDFEALLNSFNSSVSTNSLDSGILVERDNFTSFSKFRIENEINNLQTQYKEYNKYQLKDIAIEINLTRENFEEKPNSIYIPKIGTSLVASDINSAKIKHQNLFQVVLKSEIVTAEYLALFFRSDLGKQILKSLTSGSFIPNINKSDIEECVVSIPKLEEQNLLILTNQKLSKLQETVEQLKTELSLNPKNANVILDKFESIHGPLKQLSVEDEISRLLRKQVQSLQSTLTEQHNEVITKLDNIDNKIDNIQAILSNLSNEFNTIKLLPREIEDKISRMSKSIDSQLSNISQEQKQLDFYIQEIKKWFDYYELLESKSRKYLPEAEFIFDNISRLENPDYSPFIIQYCRAFENELLTKIFRAYVQSIIDRRLDLESTFTWDFHIKENGKPNDNIIFKFVNDLKKYITKDNEHWFFELGRMGEILRMLPGKTKNKSQFLQDLEVFVLLKFEKELLNIEYLEEIKTNITNYRNQSAHPTLMDTEKAMKFHKQMKECLIKLMENYKTE